MIQELTNLKKFTEAFFSNLKCEIKWDGELLIVKNVPESFESFYGKKSPYKLAFEIGIDESAELVSKGSFILKTMTSYLEQKGQTSLIKLNFERDYKEEFKHYLKLRNSELVNITKKENYKHILRLTFATTMQYLNEKEQVLNSLYVRDGKVISFNLDKYKQMEGKSTDIKVNEDTSKEAYNSAREVLKGLVDSRLKEAQNLLGEKLEREQARIKQHYSRQRQELDKHLIKLKEQLVQLEKNNVKDQQYDVKKQRILESLKNYEDPILREKLDKEEVFFLNDEAHKHALNVHNKLINSSVIYYPVFNFDLNLKHNDGVRNISIVYDPMEDVLIGNVSCETCKTELQEILICSSGHIVCNNCYDRCRFCERGLCKQCTLKVCNYCVRKLCKKCAVKCAFCWKDSCKTHSHVNYADGKIGCSSCLKQCSSCQAYADDKHMKLGINGNICLKCDKLKDIKKLVF